MTGTVSRQWLFFSSTIQEFRRPSHFLGYRTFQPWNKHLKGCTAPAAGRRILEEGCQRVVPGEKMMCLATPAKSWNSLKSLWRAELWAKWLNISCILLSNLSGSFREALHDARWIEWQKHLTTMIDGTSSFSKVETECFLPNMTLHVSAEKPINLFIRRGNIVVVMKRNI